MHAARRRFSTYIVGVRMCYCIDSVPAAWSRSACSFTLLACLRPTPLTFTLAVYAAGMLAVTSAGVPAIHVAVHTAAKSRRACQLILLHMICGYFGFVDMPLYCIRLGLFYRFYVLL